MIGASLSEALIRVRADLAALRVEWALVGGLAVSVLSEPRTTRDLDVAVAVEGDAEAERVVQQLQNRGYRLAAAPIEQTARGRLATVRMLIPGRKVEGILFDLLLASSGIEREVVAAAETLEVLPGVWVPVVQLSHLLALKILAFRPQDREDARQLLRWARPSDLEITRRLLDLIERRQYNRGADLGQRLLELQAAAAGEEP